MKNIFFILITLSIVSSSYYFVNSKSKLADSVQSNEKNIKLKNYPKDVKLKVISTIKNNLKQPQEISEEPKKIISVNTINKKIEINEDTISNLEKPKIPMIDRFGKSINPKILADNKKTFLDNVEYNFYLEEINTNWRNKNETILHNLLEEDNFSQALLNSVTCHSITCRADISHLTKIESNKFVFSLVKGLETSAFEFDHRTQLDGSITTIVFYKPVKNH